MTNKNITGNRSTCCQGTKCKTYKIISIA